MACLRDGGRLILRGAAQLLGSAFRDATGEQVAAVTEAQECVERVAARIRPGRRSRVETMIWYGSPVEAIVDAARHCKGELIVISTHGRTGLGRLMLRSVAQSVLRATSVPILLLSPDLQAAPEGTPHVMRPVDERAASMRRF